MPLLRAIDSKLKKAEQDMQRVKHAERRQQTRRRVELGEAVEEAGAAHLSRDEIIRLLSAAVGHIPAPQTEHGSAKPEPQTATNGQRQH